MARPCKVMLVEDSATIRMFLKRIIQEHPSVTFAGEAENGAEALARLPEYQPDVLLIDIEMPQMDGLTALPLILEQYPKLPVIMVSTLVKDGGASTVRALALGAADYLEKPSATTDKMQFADALMLKILSLYHATQSAPAPATVVATPPAPRRVIQTDTRPQILATGSSTGGPQALAEVFNGLKDFECPVPIVVTQHMPPKFTGFLAENIHRNTGLPCSEAKEGEPLQNGHIYIAPGDYHMTLAGITGTTRIHLNQNPPENFCRPAVDPMLRSIAGIYGKNALVVILTGMGSDGAEGCRAIKDIGGEVVAQDEKTSVVWGMPGAVVKAGLADQQLPLQAVAEFIRKRLG